MNINKTTSNINYGKMFSFLVYFAAMLLLIVSFYKNYWHIVNQEWFSTWQWDSERYVIWKIEDARVSGVFNNFGLLINYTHQVGLQGIIFSIITMGFHLPERITIQSMYLLNSMVLSGVFILFLRWTKREFGIVACIMGYLSILFNNWIIVSARNLYWVTWTMYLPMIFVLLLLEREEYNLKQNDLLLGIGVFITIFIKSANGYEFLSTIAISAALPVLYYAIKLKWKSIVWIKRSMVVFFSAIAGFIVALLVHLLQLTLLNESFSKAFIEIFNTVSKRTGLLENSTVIDPEIARTLRIPLDLILERYLQSEYAFPLINNYQMNTFIVLLGSLVVLGILITLYTKMKSIKIVALGVTTAISLTAPYSWFILARGHAVAHFHINYLLWSMPTVLLIAVFLGYVIHTIIRIIYFNNLKGTKKNVL